MALKSGTRLGVYEITAPIGAGGMGEVYRARDARLGRDVAIKVLGAEYSADVTRLTRFEQEARAVSSLNHPHIVSIFDVGTAEGHSYLVMEMVEGRSLRELLEGGALPLKKALNIAAQVADGLAKAHAAGIVHRDLKPENVMVNADGFAKVLDFGLVKLAGTQVNTLATVTAAMPATSPGMVLGTVGYMSPEQARGKEVDFRSDQFSFGTMFYEMVTGARPFVRESSAQTLAAIIEDDPKPVSELNPKVPLAVRWIIERCMAKDAEERYASTRDLARDLQSVRDHLSEASSHVSQLGIAPVHGSAWLKWRIPAAVALIALAVGVAVGAWLFRSEPDAPAAVRPLTFSGVDAVPAVSPDGRTIAFVSHRDGKDRIWIKQLAGGGEAPLTDGPRDWRPRFSPDGSMLLYRRDTSIWRISVVGSEQRRVAEDGRDPDWSPDGKQICFIRRSPASRGTDLVVAEADGGNPRVVASYPGELEGMRWSPDGKYFLGPARIAGLTSERGNFVYISTDGKEVRQIPAAVTGGDFSPVAFTSTPGEIVFMRGESVSTAGFTNPSAVAVVLQNINTGKARRLLSLPGGSDTVEILAAGRLVMDSLATHLNLVLIPLSTVDKPNTYQWLTHGNANDRQPTVSPDGEWVAFSSNRSGNLDIWEVSRKTGAVRRLTDDPADDWDPSFSPDGKQLVWSSHRSGNFEIWMAEADGSGAHQVSHDGVDAENPAMTAGGWIVYNSGHPDKHGLWKVRSDGSQPTRLTTESCNWPAASPDGQYVACNSRTFEDIVVRVSDGQVVQKLQIRGTGRTRWMPDGSGIAFLEADDAGKNSLVVAPFLKPDAPRRKLLVEGEHLFESFGFARDGKSVVITFMDVQASIVTADGVRGVAPPNRAK
jgi:Tol biopolymer transport system component